MSFEARCPQCVLVTQYLGEPTPCLLHAWLPVPDQERVEPDFDEPYTFGQVHPTVDHPGPFTLREYVRLSLLRSRVRDQRHDADHEPAQVGASARR